MLSGHRSGNKINLGQWIEQNYLTRPEIGHGFPKLNSRATYEIYFLFFREREELSRKIRKAGKETQKGSFLNRGKDELSIYPAAYLLDSVDTKSIHFRA